MKIISGGQTGVDIAALVVAKKYGIETGGYIPHGFRTLEGDKPEYAELYNLVETTSSGYAQRTGLNVQSSDATIRIATNFTSTGELCTLNAIQLYHKPYKDILVSNKQLDMPEMLRMYLGGMEDGLKDSGKDTCIINFAGNSELTSPGIYAWTVSYLTRVLEPWKNKK